jgi:transposase-like protein
MKGTKSPKSPILDALRAATQNESAAAAFLEMQRWGSEPACPRCGALDVYKMESATEEGRANFRWRCRACKRMYTIRTGTVMEESRLPLRAWCFTLWSACASKKGVSALQISRECEISYKSALFLMKRVRFAMATDHDSPPKLSGTVEVDETYVGGRPRFPRKRGTIGGPSKVSKKEVVFAMVERGGNARAMHLPGLKGARLKDRIRANVDPTARIMTDESQPYRGIGKSFDGGHHTVNHRLHEYARGDVTTNTIEGFFSLLKRGIIGTFHHVSAEHLHRYVAEFEFRYNARKISDGERVALLVRQSEGKRLTYDDATSHLGSL